MVDPAEVVDTAVEESAATPAAFVLSQNFPNPFNPQTQLHYQLPSDGLVELNIYNAAGQKVRTLVDGFQSSGLYIMRWDGRSDAGVPVASGSYIYRLEMPDAQLSQARAMTLLR